MKTYTSRLSREIAAERRSLADNLGELEVRVRAATDWRIHVQQRPWLMLGLAAGGGVLISALAPRRSRPTRSAGERLPVARTAVLGPPSPVEETWERIKGAVLAAVATEAVGLLREVLPSFHQTLVNGMRGGQRPTE
jgi:hypothetical protein